MSWKPVLVSKGFDIGAMPSNASKIALAIAGPRVNLRLRRPHRGSKVLAVQSSMSEGH